MYRGLGYGLELSYTEMHRDFDTQREITLRYFAVKKPKRPSNNFNGNRKTINQKKIQITDEYFFTRND